MQNTKHKTHCKHVYQSDSLGRESSAIGWDDNVGVAFVGATGAGISAFFNWACRSTTTCASWCTIVASIGDMVVNDDGDGFGDNDGDCSSRTLSEIR